MAEITEAGAVGLVERLEMATGPDRELDAAIARAIGWSAGYQGDGIYDCPRFTLSLECALSLVLEGCSVHLHIMPREIGHKAEVGIGHEGYSKSAPIALCIAALKSRTAYQRATPAPASNTTPTDSTRPEARRTTALPAMKEE